MNSLLIQAFIFLCAAVVMVPLARRFGFSSVLGYLIAGIAIGPVLGLVGAEAQEIQHIAEFGIVMMLFVVGLGIKPHRLWAMRAQLLGLGGLQVIVTVLLIAAIAYWLGLYWGAAIATGLIFALSSTAIVLQTLEEKGLSDTKGGQACFSVLLFQDIAVIPILALIPLLALSELSMGGAEGVGARISTAAHTRDEMGLSLVQALSGWSLALGILVAVTMGLLGERYVFRPLFRIIAKSRLREMLAAAALLLVIGVSLLMTLVGLPPALGAFLAGAMLSNSEYRHELESAIAPFKGLLLGLFFITVGAGIDFGLLLRDPATVLGLTLGIIALKGMTLFALVHLLGFKHGDRWLLALSLAPAGEFSFVLLGFSLQSSVLPLELANIFAPVIALSMLLAPLLLLFSERMLGDNRFGSNDVRNLRIFVSYSRKDTRKAQRVLEILKSEEFDVFVDFRDLPFGVEWQRELDLCIRQADVVIWLVSSNSLQSKWCDWEMGKVTEYAKRLVPVMIENLDPGRLPEAISKIQVFPRAGLFDYDDQKLVDAFIDTLRTDHHWTKAYTLLMDRAALWNHDGRSAYWLLREEELNRAQTWLNNAPDSAQRLNETVLDLIHSSEITLLQE